MLSIVITFDSNFWLKIIHKFFFLYLYESIKYKIIVRFQNDTYLFYVLAMILEYRAAFRAENTIFVEKKLKMLSIM